MEVHDEWSLLGVATEADSTEQLSGMCRPDVIVVAIDDIHGDFVGFLARLHERSPYSRILLLAENDINDPMVLAIPGVMGSLRWSSLRRETIDIVLEAVTAGLWIGNASSVGAALY